MSKFEKAATVFTAVTVGALAMLATVWCFGARGDAALLIGMLYGALTGIVVVEIIVA